MFWNRAYAILTLTLVTMHMTHSPSGLQGHTATRDPLREKQISCTNNTPVISGHDEVEQQADGLLHVYLVGGGQPLVELVEDGGQNGLQA